MTETIDNGWENIRKSYYYYYIGIGAEYQLMASLSRRCYDVAKLSVDYGFDVMARRSLGDMDHQTYYFQVKSVQFIKKEKTGKYDNEIYLNHQHTSDGDKKRKAMIGKVRISGYSLKLLEENNNAALIVYIYDPDHTDTIMEQYDTPMMYFWMNGDDVKEYRRYFKQVKSDDASNHTGGSYELNIIVVYADDDNAHQHLYVRISDTDDKKIIKSYDAEKKLNEIAPFFASSFENTEERPGRFKLSSFLK